MPLRLSCPFCNTAFELPAAPPAGRTICPRCGELVPLRARSDDDPAENAGVNPPGSPAPAPQPAFHAPRPRGLSPRTALVVVLALGLLGFGVGVFVYSRGVNRHTNNPGPDAPPSATATPPADLTGLGLLPADCNVVFAVQPGPLLAYAARTNQDPKELLTRAGVPEQFFTTLGRLGLTLQQIDHVAGGTRLADAGQQQQVRFALVLVLRTPANEEQFLRGLEASKSPGGKGRYNANVRGLPPMLMAKVSETVWVLGLDETDLEPAGRGGQSRLSPGLREMIAGRLPPDAAMWAAADSDRWAAKPLAKVLLGQVFPKLPPLLAEGQAAVVGLSAGDPPRVRVFVRCTDSETGERLRGYFQSKAADEATRTGGAGEWAMFDAPADPRAGFPALRGVLDDIK